MTPVPRDMYADASRDGSDRITKASGPGSLVEMDLDTLVADNDTDDNSPWLQNDC